jgi:hypothetical protein
MAVVSVACSAATPGPTASPSTPAPNPSAATPTSSSAGPSAATGPPRTTAPLGATGCQPPSPVSASQEVEGTTSDGSLYGLIMARLPLRARTEVKIVFRMTGAGDLRAALTAPDGRDVPVAWGPEPHAGSSYTRPGDEWGVGYVFDVAGCWHLHLTRDTTAGDVWVQVEA